MPVQHLLHPRPVALGRRDQPAGAHRGLADEGGDRLRPLALDHRLELGDQEVEELGLRHVRIGPPQVMRRVGVQEPRQRQVEARVVGRSPVSEPDTRPDP